MNKRHLTVIVAVLACTFAFTGVVRADIKTVNFTLATTSPQFNRPQAGTPPTALSAVGTACYFALQPFYVSAAGPVTMSTTAAAFTTGTADDTFIVLYANSFNPASPLTNAVSANDDSTGNLSSITATLSPGVQYYGVFTSFNNATVGTLTGSFNATSATVILGAVPEPSTWALLGAGAVGLGLSVRRQRHACRV